MLSFFLVPLQSSTELTETVSVVATAVFIGVVIWYLGKRLKTQLRTENAEVVHAGLLPMLANVAAVALVLRWNAAGTAFSVVGVLKFGIEAGARLPLRILLFIAAYTVTPILKRFLLGSGSSKHRVTSDHQRRVSY